jgi:drug/metabolite transporter (DMT)-like permease
MRVVEQLEAPVVQAFKNVPSLPAGGVETLVKAWPYLAIAFGILQLLGAYSAWSVIQFVEQFAYYHSIGASDRFMVYIGITIMLVQAVIFFVAFSPLQKRAKRGWDLLFLVGLMNVVYAIVALFMSGYGVGSFLMSLLTSAVGFYLLVQTRSSYLGKKTAAKTAKATSTRKKSKE